ncbi:hypothetical protein [Xenorhabdus budapestensis]|uniref:T3SS effector EspK n=1 Tax=Xenorhabdus budapestensis TaxID=290110 RepID=A0A2D0J3G1_XENBU|nr:hypothetical protein [Xenorhabdus budapestensis]PHM28958.1 T3SS effector EspK [Xenorhabdus budapestensis]
MPFFRPFRENFYKGDLIYGLTDSRKKYVNESKNFLIAKHCNDEALYPPIFIDNYLTPAELNHMKNFMKNYQGKNKKNNWINNEEKSSFQNRAEEYSRRYWYEKPKKQEDEDKYNHYKRDFFNHLKSHHKYRTITENINEYNKIDIGRKCKGGLSWASIVNGNLPHDMHIHFILDGINMDSVVYKHDKNITGKELRWLFRHREYPNVAKKIQFWLNDTPTTPPWEGTGSTLWKNYVCQDDYSETLSLLFNAL